MARTKRAGLKTPKQQRGLDLRKEQELREEQEILVTSVKRLCRGPYLVEAQDEEDRFAEWRRIEAADDEGAARDMIDRLVVAANAAAVPGFVFTPRTVAPGDWDGLRRVVFPLIRLRGDMVGHTCGWDLNEEIVKHPFDAAEHETKCPTCDINISWRAPVF